LNDGSSSFPRVRCGWRFQAAAFCGDAQPDPKAQGVATGRHLLPSTKSMTSTTGFNHPSGESSLGPWASRASSSPIPRTPTV
jgi:hypothetical protein